MARQQTDPRRRPGDRGGRDSRPEAYDAGRGQHGQRRAQPDWDEDRFGYPEATSYRREMSRSREDYRPEGRFAGDDGERGLHRGEGWGAGTRGHYGFGGVIDENDYRRYGGDGGRSSGGGHGMHGGRDTSGDSAADGSGARGAASAPWAARRGPYARQGPKGYSRSDERIREDVCERLYHADDVDVAEISVQVENATVRLEGTVPERWMKYRIEDICEAAAGVADIDNRIRIARAGIAAQAPAAADRAPRH